MLFIITILFFISLILLLICILADRNIRIINKSKGNIIKNLWNYNKFYCVIECLTVIFAIWMIALFS